MSDASVEMRAAEAQSRVPDIVVITGMSGSGRTQAMHALEDMGYFCIDNLPPRLILQLAEIVGINNGVGRHLAVTCDVRSQGLFDELNDALEELPSHELSYKVVFLDCSTEELMRRYNENRRRHPIAVAGESIEHAIGRERRQLESVKAHSDLVIDTSHLHANELRRRVRQAFSSLGEQQLLDVSVFSFGFKYGMPQEADLLVDVRFLANPFYDPEMRRLTSTRRCATSSLRRRSRGASRSGGSACSTSCCPATSRRARRASTWPSAAPGGSTAASPSPRRPPPTSSRRDTTSRSRTATFRART